MRADVVALATAALAIAVETQAGGGDDATLEAILAALPDGQEHALVALVRTYQAQRERYGAEALQRSGLALARRSCGLDP